MGSERKIVTVMDLLDTSKNKAIPKDKEYIFCRCKTSIINDKLDYLKYYNCIKNVASSYLKKNNIIPSELAIKVEFSFKKTKSVPMIVFFSMKDNKEANLESIKKYFDSYNYDDVFIFIPEGQESVIEVVFISGMNERIEKLVAKEELKEIGEYKIRTRELLNKDSYIEYRF